MEKASRGEPRQPARVDMERFEKAAAEVDVGLLDLALSRSPRQRLRAATRAWRALARFRRHAST